MNIYLNVMARSSDSNTPTEKTITYVTAQIFVAVSVADYRLVVVLAAVTVGALVVFALVHCGCTEKITRMVKRKSDVCQQ